MSHLASKRSRIITKLNKQQKQSYFKNRRSELLDDKQAIQDRQDQITPESTWLQQILKRSLITDGLLQEIQKHSLFQRIQSIVFSTPNLRNIRIILLILSNALLDNLTLEHQEKIAKLCISCYEMDIFNECSFGSKSGRINSMLSTAHNLNTLSATVAKLHEDLRAQSQEIVFKQIVTILQRLKHHINQISPKEQRSVFQIVQKITNAISNLVYCDYEQEERSRNLFCSRMQRSFSYMCQIIKLHAYFVMEMDFSPIIKKIHCGMLFIQQFLTSSVSITQINGVQCYYESQQLVSIILMEINENRDQLLNKAALKILHNLFIQYKNSQLLTLKAMIQLYVQRRGNQNFFTKLLEKDRLKKERMETIEHFLRENDAFSIFQPFFQRNWRDIVDNCCQMLQQQDNQTGELATQVLILSKFRHLEDYAYYFYLNSIGTYSLLSEKTSTYQENRLFGCQNSISESLYQKIDFLLDLLKQDEENSL